MTTNRPNVRATVQIDLHIADGDVEKADDLIAEVWMAGDPADVLNATLWVKDVEAIPNG